MTIAVLNRLLDMRKVAIDEGRAVIDAADAQKRDLTAADNLTIDRSFADVADLDKRIAQVRAAIDREKEADEARSRLPGGGDILPGGEDRGWGDHNFNLWLPSRRQYHELIEQRAVSSAGNPFLPAGQANTFYDRLRAAAVVLRAGPQILPLEDTTLRIPGLSASVSVSAIGENTAITPSDPTFTSVTLTPRKLAALTLAANEALDDSNPGLREIVANDLVRQTATTLDLQFLEGSGTAPNMRGFRNMSGTTSATIGGANGGTPTLDDFATAVGTLETSNANLERAAWFMSGRTWSTVRKLKDSQSRYQLSPDPGADASKSLFGVPVYLSSQIPTTETTGINTDTSHVILADMSQIVVGQRKQVEVALSTDYAFNADQTAIRVLGRFDIGVLNAAAVYLMLGVRP